MEKIQKYCLCIHIHCNCNLNLNGLGFISEKMPTYNLYKVFQRFWQAKFADRSLILKSNQFSLLSQMLQKLKFASKVVKINSKIVIMLTKI
jgi:hypothetical protein